jgi:NADH-quinone oxidoreductase subunit H
MTLLAIVIALIKAGSVVLFALTLAAVLTWFDRRGGAMFQDRVGPNRAVFFLPTRVAQTLVVVPALLVAGGAVALAAASKGDAAARASWGHLYSHLAVAAVWTIALLIAGHVGRYGIRNSFDNFMASLGDPRRIVYGGLVAHALVVVARLTVAVDAKQPWMISACGAAAAVFAFAVVAGGLYAASRMEGRKSVGLRLAGLLHPMADGLKAAFKEDFIPVRADRLLHGLAPLISLFPVLVLLAVVPFGDTVCFGVKPDGSIDLLRVLDTVPREGVCTQGAVSLQVADLNVGLLFIFALGGTGVVGAALAGWSSDNKYSLLGGLRAASQMVSYEVTLGLTLIGALMIYGTLQLDQMVQWQSENAWGIFVQPVACVLFLGAAIAETKRVPFDLPEGESEIVAGYFTEYSGMRFAMFYFSEYVAVVTTAALMTTVFFGGWHVPFLARDGLHIAIGDTVLLSQPLSHGTVILLGVASFLGKTLLLCWLQAAIRWTLPRFRYDQLMSLCWRKLLPVSLVNVLATALLVLWIQQGGAQTQDVLRAIGDVTEALVAVMGIVIAVIGVRFVLEPAHKQRLIASSVARLVATIGGLKTSRMGA